MVTERFLAAVESVRHFLATFEPGDIPAAEAENLRGWLYPDGYWWQPERSEVLVNSMARHLVDHMEHLRLGYLDALPIFVTEAQFRERGTRSASGAPMVLQYVRGAGTCLVSAVILEEPGE